MADNKKMFSTGKIAKETGLTVRTLQHYDNIGLLPVSGRTEGGRRYYTEKDLLKLEQIVFYRSIGIPLDEIKEKLVGTPTLQVLQKTLEDHMALLIKRIDTIHLAISVAESSLEVVRSGSYPPWEMLANLIRSLDSSGLTDWANYSFNENLLDTLKGRGISNTLTDTMDIYHDIRQMMVEAFTLSKTGHRPDDPAAQSLAKRWWGMIIGMTGGNEAAIMAFSKVNRNREEWPEADRKLVEAAEPFIEASMGIYIASNNIEVPDSLLNKE